MDTESTLGVETLARVLLMAAAVIRAALAQYGGGHRYVDQEAELVRGVRPVTEIKGNLLLRPSYAANKSTQNIIVGNAWQNQLRFLTLLEVICPLTGVKQL